MPDALALELAWLTAKQALESVAQPEKGYSGHHLVTDLGAGDSHDRLDGPGTSPTLGLSAGTSTATTVASANCTTARRS